MTDGKLAVQAQARRTGRGLHLIPRFVDWEVRPKLYSLISALFVARTHDAALNRILQGLHSRSEMPSWVWVRDGVHSSVQQGFSLHTLMHKSQRDSGGSL